METTIIRIGKDSLSLKEIGNRLKSSETPKNSDLSIVKNFFSKTISFNHKKSLKYIDKATNYTNNILSLKNHINFFSQLDSKKIENKLPRIIINKQDKRDKNIKSEKKRIKDNKIVLKPIIISYKNNRYGEYLNKKKNSFNVILTDQDNLICE